MFKKTYIIRKQDDYLVFRYLTKRIDVGCVDILSPYIKEVPIFTKFNPLLGISVQIDIITYVKLLWTDNQKLNAVVNGQRYLARQIALYQWELIQKCLVIP